MKNIENHLKMFKVFTNCSPEDKKDIMDIYDELAPKGKILVDKTVRKYEAGKAAGVFNREFLSELCENLKIEVADKVRRGTVDRKGMWNYLARCFSNKCQDHYHSEINTQTRGAVDHSSICEENKDQVDYENSVDFEQSIVSKEEVENIISYLSDYDRPNKPYSKIIKLMLEGNTLKEIGEEMPFSASTLERHKRKACEILMKSPEFDRDNFKDLIPDEKLKFLYLKARENPYRLEESTYKEFFFKNNKVTGRLMYSVQVKSHKDGKDKCLVNEVILLNEVKFKSQEKVELHLIDGGYDHIKEEFKTKLTKGYDV